MNPLADAVTAALLHSLWQGAALALILSITLFALRNRTASARHTASVLALTAIVLVPTGTAAWLYRPAPGAGIATPALVDATTAIVVTANTPPQAEPGFGLADLGPWLLPFWALGVALCSLRLILAATRLGRLRRGPPAALPTQSRVRELAGRMGIARPPKVIDAAIDAGPGVAGWLRPVIFLPSATLAGLAPEQLEAIVAHELAHIKRHDYLINVCQMAVEALLFFNPAAWWVSSRIRIERELACDDMAIAASGDAFAYARALTQLERRRLAAPPPALGTTDGPLAARIRHAIGERPVHAAARIPAALGITLAIAGVVLSFSPLNARVAQVALPEPPAPAPVPASPAPVTTAPPAPPASPVAAPAPVPPAPLPPPPPRPPQTGVIDEWVLYRYSDGQLIRALGSGLGAGTGQGIGTGIGAGVGAGDGRAPGGLPGLVPPAPESVGGEALWFVHDGRAWLIRDPEILGEVSDLLAVGDFQLRLRRAVAEEQLRSREMVAATQLAAMEANLARLRQESGQNPDRDENAPPVSASEVREELEELVGGIDTGASPAQLEARLRSIRATLEARLAAVRAGSEIRNRISEIERAIAETRLQSEAADRATATPLVGAARTERLLRLIEEAISSGRAVPAP